MRPRPRWPHFVVRLKCRGDKHPPAYPIEVLGVGPRENFWNAKPRNIWSCECGQETYEHKAYA